MAVSPDDGSSWKPVIVNNGTLQLMANGARLQLAGVVVLGVPGLNQFTADFSIGKGAFSARQGQYPNRELICATIKAWGGNAIRLRFDSTDIAAGNFNWTTAEYLECIKDWVSAAKANGLYTTVSDWSAFEAPPAGQAQDDWPTWLPSSAFPIWEKIADTLRLSDGSHDPYVFWEPLNEPANVAWPAWLGAFKVIAAFFRQTLAYTGVLVCDGLDGSSSWDAPSFAALSTYDASLPGMDGEAQVAFTNHDYALTTKPSVFSSPNWLDQTLAQTVTASVVPAGLVTSIANQYCRFETEFGNNVVGYGGNAQWSGQAASFFQSLYGQLTGYAGAYAYVWGPWSDANAICTGDNTTPSEPWGDTVKQFLAAADATPVTVTSA